MNNTKIFILILTLIYSMACQDQTERDDNHEDYLTRKLPPTNNENSRIEKNKHRNILVVTVNANNTIIINGKLTELEEVCKVAKNFYLNKTNNKNLPEKEEQDLPKIGIVQISKGVISLQTYRNTGYELYLQVQNELVRAVNDLRDDFAQKNFSKNFDDLSHEDQEIVRKVFPLAISEAEPRRMTK